MLFEGMDPTIEYYSLAREILSLAQRDFQKNALLDEIAKVVVRFSGCEGVDIHLMESGRRHHGNAECESTANGVQARNGLPGTGAEPRAHDQEPSETLCRSLLEEQIVASGAHFTAAGSFLTGAADQPVELVLAGTDETGKTRTLSLVPIPDGPFKSVAATLFHLGEEDVGLLVLKSLHRNYFSNGAVEVYESISQFLGASIMHQRKHLALRERVKELTCLYGIARLVDRADISLDRFLQSAVELLPPAWLYPEVTSARIVMDGKAFYSDSFSEGCSQLRSSISVEGQERGFVEVTYREERPELDEGPFLREERNLLDAVAKELLLIAERYRAAKEREQLQKQLRHADRLATIGQLSAGVAHELNEPLGGILGFAQLSQKHPDIPPQIRKDLEKIVSASLHAREIVRKLMLFARQSPPEKTWLHLNLLIADGLYFIESRCRKSGIELVRQLDDNLPEITADPGQIYQVLINLAVNAIQAMPDGGRLTIRTAREGSGIRLVAEDTGIGMSDEVLKNIFTPFYTTKDVGEGTGLGLSVVEGIINSHGGSITVESRLGEGTKFGVYLPLNAPSRHSK
jgi:signal transduction histidine kinase